MLFIIVLSWVVYVCIYSNHTVERILETACQRVGKWKANDQTFLSTKLKHDNFRYIVLHQFYCVVNVVFIGAKSRHMATSSYRYSVGRIMESKFLNFVNLSGEQRWTENRYESKYVIWNYVCFSDGHDIYSRILIYSQRLFLWIGYSSHLQL